MSCVCVWWGAYGLAFKFPKESMVGKLYITVFIRTQAKKKMKINRKLERKPIQKKCMLRTIENP